jgi:hypothetical protein
MGLKASQLFAQQLEVLILAQQRGGICSIRMLVNNRNISKAAEMWQLKVLGK